MDYYEWLDEVESNAYNEAMALLRGYER